MNVNTEEKLWRRGDIRFEIRHCIGYGDMEGKCQNMTDGTNPLWCPECDEKRIAKINAEMEIFEAELNEKLKKMRGEK